MKNRAKYSSSIIYCIDICKKNEIVKIKKRIFHA